MLGLSTIRTDILSFVRNHRLASALILGLWLAAAVGGGIIIKQSANAATNSNIVIVNYDQHQQIVPTQAKTVGQLLDEIHVRIHKGDVVEPSQTTVINQNKFRINVYRAQPVVIIDGEHKTYTSSASLSPRAVAAAAGVVVYPEDYLSQGPVTDFLHDNAVGHRIVIDRATPVDLLLYGHASTIRTHAKTIGDLVKQEGIVLKPGDTLAPAASTPIVSGLKVAVNHKGTHYQTIAESIPMPVKYVADSTLSIGTSAVRQAGGNGEREVTYEITTSDGHEVSRKSVQSIVTTKPVERIVARGTAMVSVSGSHAEWMSTAGISAADQPYADFIIDHESNWNPASLNSLGCAGLGQACPGSKLAAACPNWQSDPVCQLRFFDGYASGKGGWYNSYLTWRAQGWW